MSSQPSLLARLLIALVGGYRLVPRLGPARCRFYPTCSSYAIEALETHGALHGTALTVRRLLRCHPFHPGGVDHVPPIAPRGGNGRDSLLKGNIRV